MTPRFWTAALLAVLNLAPLRSSSASEAPPSPSRSLFQQIFAQPTGRNGYEELVVACDHLKASQPFQQLDPEHPTLTDMRRVLADRHVTDSLRLLRAGLAKPITSPRDSANFQSQFPEVPELRSLARLLRVEQTVLLADGRNIEAVASFRRGLQLSRVVQFDTILQGMVGNAMQAIQAKSIGEHLDQLSARDCEQLFQICVAELRQPNPAPGILDGERRIARASVGSMSADIRKRGPSALGEHLGLGDEQVKAITPFVQGLLADPQALDSLTTQIQQLFDQYYTRAAEESRKPAWERVDVDAEFPRDNSPAGFAVNTLLPNMSRALDSFTAREGYLRVIACHCAIRRYEWEHGDLPAALDDLKLGDLAIDPFLGEPLRYTHRGRRYSLTAAGHRTLANDTKTINGRVPLAIGRDD